MSETPLRDLIVGGFVLAGLAAIAYLSISLGGMSYRGPGGLKIVATFDEIGGLKVRSPVVIGGVKVGQVTAISLDDDLRARVALDVDSTVEIPSDTSASILTAGVLGDQYVALEPGGESDPLQSGDEIAFTQSAVILERLVGKMVQNIGGGDAE